MAGNSIEARPYRPSTGTEGVGFMERFCCQCERDKNEDCQILADSFAFEVDDPNYPREWIQDSDGPRCTAFVPAGGEIPYRCPKTADMFK